MLLWSFLCAVIFSTHRGLCQDVAMTCPAKWNDGNTVTLSCSVKKSQWQDINPCSISYSENVYFNFLPNGQIVESTEKIIQNVKSNCSSFPNLNRCWCNESSAHYFLFCNVTADKAKYDGGSWKCLPDCVSNSGIPLTVLKTKECEFTAFYDVCEGNPCAPGICLQKNNQAECNCNNTYYTSNGTNCKGDPCSGKSNCYVKFNPGGTPGPFVINQTTANVTINGTTCTCVIEVIISCVTTGSPHIIVIVVSVYVVIYKGKVKIPIKPPSSESERKKLEEGIQAHLQGAGIKNVEVLFQDDCIELLVRNYWKRSTAAALITANLNKPQPEPPTTKG